MQLELISMSFEMKKFLKCLTLAGKVSCCPTAMTPVKKFSLGLVLEMVVPKRKFGRKDFFTFYYCQYSIVIQTSSSKLCAKEEPSILNCSWFFCLHPEVGAGNTHRHIFLMCTLGNQCYLMGSS